MNPKCLSYKEKLVVSFLAISLLNQIFFTTIIWAISSGPTQPEFSTFESVGSSDMVDLFTGDFKYNLPLFEIPGPRGSYPLNLFYNSVTNVEDEASMVGLGWNIGVGAIQRTVRGIPDDFNGEKIKQKYHRKPDETYSVTGSFNKELASLDFDKKEGSSANDDTPSDSILLKKYGQLSISFLSLDYNTYNGFGIRPLSNISLQLKTDDNKFGLGASLLLNYNSIHGSSVGVSVYKDILLPFMNQNFKYRMGGPLVSYSLNNQTFTSPLIPNKLLLSPTINRGILSRTISGSFEFGTENFFVEPKGAVLGTFSRSVTVDNDEWIQKNLYGSMYNSNAQTDDNALMDFTKLNNRPIFKGNENLPLPISNEDFFSVTGQGIGGTFKLFRNDIGIYHDNKVDVSANGYSAGINLGTGSGIKVGGDFTLTNSTSKSDSRSLEISSNTALEFKNELAQDQTGEVMYFDYIYNNGGYTTNSGTHLDKNYKYWSDDQPVSNTLNKNNLGSQLVDKSGAVTAVGTSLIESKQARTKNIRYYTNEMLRSNLEDKHAIFPEFEIKYESLEGGGNEIPGDLYSPSNFIRPNDQKIGAFAITDENGTNWNYGLPVMNHKKIEASFSINSPSTNLNDCTQNADITINGISCEDRNIEYKHDLLLNDQLLDISETPSYAHSHLLTSVLGVDYIDSDPNDGLPNNSDFGHWVRFEYIQTNNADNPFKWRYPFSKAQWHRNMRNVPEDDKGSFSYGERDQYYPYRIYTSTHYAQFYYSKRDDNRGAACWLQNDNDCEAYSYKLDSLQLFRYDGSLKSSSKKVLVKTIYFNYKHKDAPSKNELCKAVPNNEVTDGGKLTLHAVRIKEQNNNRGFELPYRFEYNSAGYTIEYDIALYVDRWGIRKPSSETDCDGFYEPFVSQSTDAQSHTSLVKTWHLERIVLPSGSQINIDVGRDHYGYVQSNKATQMFNINGFNQEDEGIYEIPKADLKSNPDKKRVYFRLIKNINESDADKESKLKAYFKDLIRDENGYQIAFKLSVDLLNNGVYEDIVGVGYLKNNPVINIDFGFGPKSMNGDYYYSAWINIEPVRDKINGKYLSPMLVASMQKIKEELRTILMEGESINGSVHSSFKKILSFKKLAIKIFGNFYNYLFDDAFAFNCKPATSYIRLNNPYEFKWGDGVRVNSITIQNVDSDAGMQSAYGTFYDYEKTKVINGETLRVSTGVALNEPIIGSIETAYKHFIKYDRNLKRTYNSIYQDEQPLNSALIGAAKVGYSEVKVRSLASQYHYSKYDTDTEIENNLVLQFDPNSEIGTDIQSTGQTVYEFYTAKDFPVIFDETRIKEKLKSPASRILSFIGGIRNDKYSAVKGYAVVLNDMHGKLKAIRQYAQKKSGDFEQTPVMYTEYEYLHSEKVINEQLSSSRKVKQPVNSVSFMLDYLDDNINEAITESGELGVRRELYTHVAHSKNAYTNVGITLNLHFNPLFFFAPTGLPQISRNSTELKYAVTNKIIRKRGILNKVITYDGQSRRELRNHLFDPYSGAAVVNSETNQFNTPIYSLNVPAYQEYKRMGHAYRNWNLQFEISEKVDIVEESWKNCCSDLLEIPSGNLNTEITSQLNQGDVFAVWKPELTSSNVTSMNKYMATYLHKLNGKYVFHIYDADRLSDFYEYPSRYLVEDPYYDYRFELVKSGNSNQLDANCLNLATVNKFPLEYHNNNATSSRSMMICTVSDTARIKAIELDSVLDAQAQTYEDFWHYLSTSKRNTSSTKSYNDFQRGNLGIFRPQISAKYKTSRNQDGIARWGVFEKFELFDFNKPRYNFDVASNLVDHWVKENEITQYHITGHEKESLSREGLYSSSKLVHNNVLDQINPNIPIPAATSPSDPAPNFSHQLGVVSAVFNNASYIESGTSNFEKDEDAIIFSKYRISDKLSTIDGKDMAYDVLACENSYLYINRPNYMKDTLNSPALKYVQDEQVILSEGTKGILTDVDGCAKGFSKYAYSDTSCVANCIDSTFCADEGGGQGGLDCGQIEICINYESSSFTEPSSTRASGGNLLDVAGDYTVYVNYSSADLLCSDSALNVTIIFTFANGVTENYDLTGVVNGISHECYSPSTDENLVKVEVEVNFVGTGVCINCNGTFSMYRDIGVDCPTNNYTDCQQFAIDHSSVYPPGGIVSRPGSTTASCIGEPVRVVFEHSNRDNYTPAFSAIAYNSYGDTKQFHAHSGQNIKHNHSEIDLNRFNVIKDEKYFVSFWATMTDSTGAYIDQNEIGINIPNATILDQESELQVNDWRRYGYIVEWNAIPSKLDVFADSLNSGNLVIIDDLVIIPVAASMESYALDQFYLRPKDMLDAYNMKSTYIYNTEGKLVGINKEHVDGTITSKEQRKNINISN